LLTGTYRKVGTEYFTLYIFFAHIELNKKSGAEEPEAGLDPKCYRANGFFNHEDPKVCNK
jgi:hypothetical protein